MPSLQSVKQRVLECLTKLSDQDTHSIAVAKLESIALSLDQTTMPFIIFCSSPFIKRSASYNYKCYTTTSLITQHYLNHMHSTVSCACDGGCHCGIMMVWALRAIIATWVTVLVLPSFVENIFVPFRKKKKK
ncbi:hypothetical protein AHAS_Ahas13G0382200 [Arachis hypogaea]